MFFPVGKLGCQDMQEYVTEQEHYPGKTRSTVQKDRPNMIKRIDTESASWKAPPVKQSKKDMKFAGRKEQ